MPPFGASSRLTTCFPSCATSASFGWCSCSLDRQELHPVLHAVLWVRVRCPECALDRVTFFEAQPQRVLSDVELILHAVSPGWMFLWRAKLSSLGSSLRNFGHVDSVRSECNFLPGWHCARSHKFPQSLCVGWHGGYVTPICDNCQWISGELLRIVWAQGSLILLFPDTDHVRESLSFHRPVVEGWVLPVCELS